MKRRAFIAFLGVAAAWPLAARAQQGAKIPRVGIVSPGRSDASSHMKPLDGFCDTIEPEIDLVAADSSPSNPYSIGLIYY
jgi:hypothetical protein